MQATSPLLATISCGETSRQRLPYRPPPPLPPVRPDLMLVWTFMGVS